jgi:glycosidase
MRRFVQLLGAAMVVAVVAAAPAPVTAQGPPKVTKVEPPHWWAGMKTSKVEVLLTGTGLAGLQVRSEDPQVAVGTVSPSTAGPYAFVELTISPAAPARTYVLTLANAAGKSRLEFPVKKKPSPEGRFQGISSDDIIYLVMPDRFAAGGPGRGATRPGDAVDVRAVPRARHGGDLQGMIDRLPYLQDLGVTALWLTPVYQNGAGESYHGYWVADHYAVDRHLGDLNGYRRLVKAAHAAGIKVIQDQVLNHTAADHPWVAHPPTSAWWHGTPGEHPNSDGGQLAALADPHASRAATRKVLDGWFANSLPDLRQEDDPQLRRYLIQNSLWWVAETGVDCIRLDAYPYVPRAFWRGWQRALRAEFPKVTAVGEVWHKSPHVVAYFQGGRAGFDGIDTGLPALFDFPLALTLRDVLGKDKEMSRVPQVLEQDRLYTDPSMLVTFAGNHDLPRLAEVLKQDVARIKLAHTIVLTCRGVPQLYYGDEIGMAGGKDPDNRQDFPGGFAGDRHSAFDEEGRTAREAGLIGHWRAWVKVRKGSEALRRGDLVTLFADKEVWVFLRSTPKERVLVAVSKALGPRTVRLPVPEEMMGARELVLLVGKANEASVSGGLKITLPAAGAAAWLVGG